MDREAQRIKWEDIPSLEDIMVDWNYEPEDPLGKRGWERIAKTDLHSFLSVKSIAIKVVSRKIAEIGSLVDISPTGLAVLLESNLSDGQPVKIGFYLGKQKVVSRAVVRNVCSLNGTYRVGMEFVDLAKEDASFIAGLFPSKAYRNYRTK